ncbi:MAG: response regulator [Defluviitaleaceae bacterium]|nr:response regulator [Defluviitaleaceae bacterium]
MKNVSDPNYIKRVSSLFLPFQVNAETIHAGINSYIDQIENYTERLEISYNSNNMYEFTGVLERIQDLLQAVCAKRQEAYTVTLIRSARNGVNEFSARVLQQAIADFLLLSIEMQKAQNLLDTSPAFKYSAVEKDEEAANNLSAVIRLIEAQDYDRAKSMVSEMSNKGFAAGLLSNAFIKEDYNQAKDIATAMHKEYIGKVNQVSAGRGSKTVLAVDDRPEILTSVNTALRSHFKTLGAPGGKVALDIMGQQDIDLFILDIDMPEMDGFELARRIRSDRKYADTPIIFLTGNSSRDRILKATRLGISDFIVKPAYNETLLTKVKKYLEQ